MPENANSQADINCFLVLGIRYVTCCGPQFCDCKSLHLSSIFFRIVQFCFGCFFFIYMLDLYFDFKMTERKFLRNHSET